MSTTTPENPAWTSLQLRTALGLSRGGLAAAVKAGRIPKPIKLGHRTLRWPADVVERVLAERGAQ